MEEACLLIDLLFSSVPVQLVKRAHQLGYITAIEKFLIFASDSALEQIIHLPELDSVFTPQTSWLLQYPNFKPLIEDVLKIAAVVDLDLDQFKKRGITRQVIKKFVYKNIIEDNYDVVKAYFDKRYVSAVDHLDVEIAIIVGNKNIFELILEYFPVENTEIFSTRFVTRRNTKKYVLEKYATEGDVIGM